MSDKESKFDVRIVERNIAGGIVSANDYKKKIKDLKDSEDNAEFVPIEEEERDGEDSEQEEAE